MLNPNGANIYSAGFTALADLVYKIVVTDTPKGKNVSKDWDKAYNALLLLEALENPTRIDEADANALYDCVVQVLEIFDTSIYPTPVSPPAVVINQGPPGPGGGTGATGATGGGTDFNIGVITVTTIADSFPLTSAYAARWDYIVNGTSQRAGTIRATWIEDGSVLDWEDQSTPDVNGSTAGVDFTVTYAAGVIKLNAVVTSGTWAISGTRYWIPGNGNYLPPVSTILSNGYIWIGNSANSPVERLLSGVIAITNLGVTSYNVGSILDIAINSSANIALSKLASLPLNKVAVTNAVTGKIETANTTIAEINFSVGLTGVIQTQINGKQDVITGGATTITSANLAFDKLLISSGTGKVAVSTVTALEAAQLVGIGTVSTIQVQLNGKQATITGAASTVTSSNLTAGKILGSDGAGKIYATTFDVSAVSTVSNTGATNEILKSDGVNVVGTKLFSSVNGDMILGSSALSGNRTISKARGSNLGQLVISAPAGILGSIVGDDISVIAGDGYSGGGVANGGAINILTGTGFSGGLGGSLNLQSTSGDIFINSYVGGTAPNSSMALYVNASVNFQSGKRILMLGNANTIPTGNPSSAIFMYSEGGNFRIRSAGGLIFKTEEVVSGTYTPTITNVVNVAASSAPHAIYMRIGNIVHVSGIVNIDPTTAATATQFRISLPIASDLTAAGDLVGVGAEGSVVNTSGSAAIIDVDTTNDCAIVSYACMDGSNHGFSFSFQYIIK